MRTGGFLVFQLFPPNIPLEKIEKMESPGGGCDGEDCFFLALFMRNSSFAMSEPPFSHPKKSIRIEPDSIFNEFSFSLYYET